MLCVLNNICNIKVFISQVALEPIILHQVIDLYGENTHINGYTCYPISLQVVTKSSHIETSFLVTLIELPLGHTYMPM